MNPKVMQLVEVDDEAGILCAACCSALMGGHRIASRSSEVRQYCLVYNVYPFYPVILEGVCHTCHAAGNMHSAIIAAWPLSNTPPLLHVLPRQDPAHRLSTQHRQPCSGSRMQGRSHFNSVIILTTFVPNIVRALDPRAWVFQAAHCCAATTAPDQGTSLLSVVHLRCRERSGSNTKSSASWRKPSGSSCKPSRPPRPLEMQLPTSNSVYDWCWCRATLDGTVARGRES